MASDVILYERKSAKFSKIHRASYEFEIKKNPSTGIFWCAARRRWCAAIPSGLLASILDLFSIETIISQLFHFGLILERYGWEQVPKQ